MTGFEALFFLTLPHNYGDSAAFNNKITARLFKHLHNDKHLAHPIYVTLDSAPWSNLGLLCGIYFSESLYHLLA